MIAKSEKALHLQNSFGDEPYEQHKYHWKQDVKRAGTQPVVKLKWGIADSVAIKAFCGKSRVRVKVPNWRFYLQ